LESYKRILSIRMCLVRAYLAYACVWYAHAKYARTIRRRMLSMRLPMVRAYLACAYEWYAHA